MNIVVALILSMSPGSAKSGETALEAIQDLANRKTINTEISTYQISFFLPESR